MENTNKKEILEFFDDTSKLLSNVAITLGSNGIAQNYVEGVEFWQWLDVNYKAIDHNASSVVEFLEKGGNHNQFFAKIYEWDYYNYDRRRISKIFTRFDLPNDPTNEGFDLTERHFFGLGKTEEYQIKSDISGIPKINENTTPHTTKFIASAENVDGIERKGYATEAFMDNNSIKARREEMLEQALNGEAEFTYDFLDISGTMCKAGMFGFAIGIGMESIASYREYKSGMIDAKEYINIKKAPRITIFSCCSIT